MKETERINKSVLTADSIESKRGWSLAQKDGIVLCYYCKSPLFYFLKELGIVEESNLWDIKVIHKEREPQYILREVGLLLYCAECGNFHDDYSKYFYPKDKLVCGWSDEELDIAEIEEIMYCLEQWNQKGDFTPRFKNSQMNYLKKKLKEYEEKYYGKKLKVKISKSLK
ncbi:MAG: hypothetical protein AABX29_02370 [Nanoarchaeota archaeon]